MHIALCIKQTLDVTGPFNLTEETATLDNAGLVKIANPADLAALALVQAAFSQKNTKVTSISVGPKSTELVLRKSIALGADEAIRVWDTALDGKKLEGDTVVRVLAATLTSIGFDLIVCGSRGLCNASGYVGPALAEILGLAQVCSVSHLESSPEENKVIVYRRLERGDREVVTCQLPAIFTVDEGAVEIPYPSFPQVLAAERSKIEIRDLPSIGLKPADIRTVGAGQFNYYIPPRPRTKKSATSEAALSPLQQMQQMMGGGTASKTSSIVEGDPKKAAAEIVRFLESNGILV